MFQLDTAIGDWKRAYSACETVSSEALDELESHLCDSVVTLGNTGLSEEEAFLVATHRLGSAPQLEGEYDKVNQGQLWLRRTVLMLSGYLLLSLLFKFIAFDQTAAGALTMVFGLGSTGIPLPFFGQDYHLHSGALIQGLMGLAGLGIMSWLILAFAQGRWQSTFVTQPKRVWILLACWAGAHVVISLSQFAIRAALSQKVSPMEFGIYNASAGMVSFAYQVIAAVIILGLTALLSHRCLQSKT